MRDIDKLPKTNIEFVKPFFKIGQTIYIPQQDEVDETTVRKYVAEIIPYEEGILGAVVGYVPEQMFVFMRRGTESKLVESLSACEIYTDKEKAERASKFFKVELDEESWKKAIGDRDEKDESSPYNTDNCDLQACCSNISEARDILYYCKAQGGLIVHEREELEEILNRHGLEIGKYLGNIFDQLKVNLE